MNNIDLAQLDKLEALACAADQGEGQHMYSNWRDSNNWQANLAWLKAAEPAAILSLTALARRSLTSGAPAEPVARIDIVDGLPNRDTMFIDGAKLGSGIHDLYAGPVHDAAAPSNEQALADMEARKDAAYYERNQVVAALAKCFPSGVARTAIEGWSEDWHGCVYIDLPTGQVSWHFHDSQAHLFAGLPPYAGKWDGHDTPEKYRRVGALEVSAGAAAKTDHAPGGHAVDEDGELAAAMGRRFPMPDTSHTSVMQRAIERRSAYEFGWSDRAALSKLDWQQGYADALDLHELKPGAAPGQARAAVLDAIEALEMAATFIESIKIEELELWREVKVAEIRRDLRKLAASPEPATAAVPAEKMRTCSKLGHRCNCATDCDPSQPHPSASQPVEHPADDARDAQTQAARDVMAERRRQVEAEGWAPAHDDAYQSLELNRAAASYISFGGNEAPGIWPWPREWWKPTSYRRNLVKAGALVLAEIERLDRAAMAAAQQDAKGEQP